MRKTRAILAIFKMRATLVTAAGVALTALLAACGPASSLNPLFTDKDLIFDPTLVGEWAEKGPDHSRLRFEQAGPTAYRAISIDQQGSGGNLTETPYEAHLVRLGAYRFLDVSPLQLTTANDSQPLGPVPAASDSTQSRFLQVGDGFYLELQGSGSNDSQAPGQANLRRGHWIFRLDNSGRTMRLTALDDDWLKSAIDQGDVTIAHSASDRDKKEIVITATTGEFQQLVLDHATDQKAFPDTTVFVKLK
jgi:hypothetical protein